MGDGADLFRDLIDRHLPLVRALARRYSGRGETLDDLVQVGAVALVAAARRFDARRGVPFAAYAVPTVDGELRRHLRDRASTIRVPRREQELATTVRRAASDVAQKLGHEPSLPEAAAAAGVSVQEAQSALGALEAPVRLAALAEQPSGDAAEALEACERRTLVDELLAGLAPREREVVRLRFGDDLSQAEIARRMEISQSQASRLLAATLAKLRHAAEAGLDDAA
jgi:RNA polymerase sigma-B factor